jgi:outer membrane protein
MKWRESLIILNIALTAMILFLLFSNRDNERSGYILNSQVFEGFKGKKELEQKLTRLRAENTRYLDSLSLLVKNNPSESVKSAFMQTQQQLMLKEQQVSAAYTEDLWKRINEYVLAYGKENKYDFIYGASGEGNLMYADESKNISLEVIEYMNKKYESE